MARTPRERSRCGRSPAGGSLLSQPMKPSFPVISLIESSWSSGITAAQSRRLIGRKGAGSSPNGDFGQKRGWLPGKDLKKSVQLADLRPQNLVS